MAGEIFIYIGLQLPDSSPAPKKAGEVIIYTSPAPEKCINTSPATPPEKYLYTPVGEVFIYTAGEVFIHFSGAGEAGEAGEVFIYTGCKILKTSTLTMLYKSSSYYLPFMHHFALSQLFHLLL